MNKVVLVGYSGHAYVVANILLLQQYDVLGYLEHTEKEINPYGFNFLGSESETEKLIGYAKENVRYFIGIGDNHLRLKVDTFLLKFSLRTVLLKHPTSIVASNVGLDQGTLVCAGAIVNPLTEIERACIINTGSIIEHECKIREYAHIGPGSILAGNVTVGRAAFVGAGTTIKQGLTIGNNAVIGAGSIVLTDVPDNETWVGNPAKPILRYK